MLISPSPLASPLESSLEAPLERPSRSGSRIGFLSTYAPDLCGLATFTAALERELRRSGHAVDVVRVVDPHDAEHQAGSVAAEHQAGSVAAEHQAGSVAAEHAIGVSASIHETADTFSRCDVVIVQHEYGIYGGPDGDEVLAVLDALALRRVPTIVVLHTVPAQPTPHQRFVLEAVVALATRAVVMTSAADDRLIENYAVDPVSIATIPHGAATVGLDGARREPADARLLTWGLLGPGKGIEHAIDALTILGHQNLRPRYTVAGITHPKVFARDGDAYRNAMLQRAFAGGVSRWVRFDDAYRDVARLTRMIAGAAVVVLPYDSRDQVTSGVLVDAIAAGRPVVATAFPHAVELLSTGAGIVVPHDDPVALADAIRLLVTDQQAWSETAAEARRIAPSLSWSTVAGRYAALCDELSPIRGGR